ncbi:MAG: NHL domain-containing protein [Bacteroidia bacterium]
MKNLLLIICFAFVINTNAQSGIISTIAGNGTGGYSGDGGQATSAELRNPSGVTFDAAGNLYVADEQNNAVRKVNTAGIISTFAGSISGFSGDGGQATSAELNIPTSIAFDAAGNVYIADGVNNRIRVVNTAGIITTFAGGGTYTVAPWGDGGDATAAVLYGPSGVASDATGNLYIADQGHMRIRKVNTAGIISTFAGNGAGGFSGDGAQATAAKLNQPTGVTFDAAGNLYISDYVNNRIRMVNTAGIITTFAGNGTAGFLGDAGQATVAELNHPYGVAFDAAGNMYIADVSNNRIRVVNTAGIITTFAGNGTGGFFGDGGAATAAELNYPYGIACDAAGNLYIADAYNSRIRMICFSSCSTNAIQQITNSNAVSIYPNPANTIINVGVPSGSLGIMNENTTLQITDMLGNTVKQFIIHNSSFTISVSDLAEGVYNVSISSNEGVVNKRVVIVR